MTNCEKVILHQRRDDFQENERFKLNGDHYTNPMKEAPMPGSMSDSKTYFRPKVVLLINFKETFYRFLASLLS